MGREVSLDYFGDKLWVVYISSLILNLVYRYKGMHFQDSPGDRVDVLTQITTKTKQINYSQNNHLNCTVKVNIFINSNMQGAFDHN